MLREVFAQNGGEMSDIVISLESGSSSFTRSLSVVSNVMKFAACEQ